MININRITFAISQKLMIPFYAGITTTHRCRLKSVATNHKSGTNGIANHVGSWKFGLRE